MKRDEIIATLKQREPDLRAHGVTHAGLFGSVARNEQTVESDIDIVITIDPALAETMAIYDHVGLKRYVAGLFEGPVDVVDRAALKPGISRAATADAIYAF